MVASLLGVCIANGWLVEVDDQGRASEDGDEFAPWEFHDLLFHVHSRRGRNPHPVGATYPWRGRLEAEPAFVDDVCERPIPLLRPAVGEPLAPIDQLLASRRTRYSTAPVPLDALGRLLYFSCRVISVAKSGDELLIKKPYPSPGSLHPLDTYVIVARCPELDRGLYRYEAREHALIPIGGPSAEIDDLLNEARRGTGCLDEEPSILLVFSARFRRLSWKYQSIAYHLLLQEVGGLYQTLYLVAEALGLAACALGAGDSDNFARAAGTNYYRATSVGEFLLGGRT